MFKIHFLFEILGNITALILFLVPLVTFWKIIQKKSTEQFSGFPYVSTLLNCLLSAWYGMPFVSPNNLLMSTVNGTGAVIEFFYAIVFIWYIRDKKYMVKIFGLLVAVLSFFAMVVLVSLLALHGQVRRLFCGFVCAIFSICMYGSPLSVMEKDGSEGPYCLEIEAGGLVLYSSNLTEQWTLPFHERGRRDSDAITHSSNKPGGRPTFGNDPEGKHGCHHMIELTLANSTSEETNTALYCLNTPGFNTNRSFLRVGFDGELKIYSYSQFNQWDITYLRSGCWQGVPPCDLATKNGGSKVVPTSCQCVASAQADGFLGSGSCALPSLADSKDTSSCNSSFGLYELEGPEHFSSHHVSENPNPVGETETEECRRKCSHDCYTCAAFSLWKQSPACLHTKQCSRLLWR